MPIVKRAKPSAISNTHSDSQNSRPQPLTAVEDAAESKIASNSNRLHERFSWSSAHISGPAHVIKIEVFDRHKWHPSVSPDGVPVLVARWRS